LPATDTHVRLSHSTAHRPPCFLTCCRRLHCTAAAPLSPLPTPTSASPTPQPTALRVSQHAAATSTAQPPHLPARHRHPHPPPSLISQPPSVLLNTLPPPPHRSRRTSQLATDTHIRLLHSSANRPPCFSIRCRRRHITAAIRSVPASRCIAIPPSRHPTVPPPCRPVIPPSRRPVIPLSRRPTVPPSWTSSVA